MKEWCLTPLTRHNLDSIPFFMVISCTLHTRNVLSTMGEWA